MPNPNKPLAGELVSAVERMSDTFEARSIRYAVIGGIAATLRGRPRFTHDVDILLDVPQLVLPRLLDDLAAQEFEFEPATIIREYVRDSMTTMRFGAVRIDWLKPVLPVYSHAINSATLLAWTENHEIRVVTAESLILTKLIAFRPQDQEDIRMLLAANRGELDCHQILREWSALAVDGDQRTTWIEMAMSEPNPSVE